VAFHSFGGWKNSAFGDTNQHGAEGDADSTTSIGLPPLASVNIAIRVARRPRVLCVLIIIEHHSRRLIPLT
jgi:hypothetical protein